MGKYCFYRRRQRLSPLSPTPEPGPPPAPTLAVEVDTVVQRATGNDDSGGFIVLQANSGGGWEDYDNAAWVAAHPWGNVAEYGGLDLRAYEIGNGTAYIGQSPYSDILGL